MSAHATLPPTFIVLVAALAANAILTWWIVTYCAICGRTIGRGSGGRCPACARNSER